jgi:hypothetical protein
MENSYNLINYAGKIYRIFISKINEDHIKYGFDASFTELTLYYNSTSYPSNKIEFIAPCE